MVYEMKCVYICGHFLYHAKGNVVTLYVHIMFCTTDVDECEDSSLNNCSKFANCNNTIGGYTCTCQQRYTELENGTICCETIALFHVNCQCIT